MIRIALIFILCALMNSITTAQKISVEKINPSTAAKAKLERKGVIYSLPKNLIVVEFGIKKSKTDGTSVPNFCQVNPEMCQKLGIKKVFREKDSLVQISDFKISTRAIPDTAQIYRLKLKKQWNKDFTYNISISEQGLLQGAEIAVTDKTFEVIGQGLGTLLSIAATIVALRPSGEQSEVQKKEEKEKKQIESIVKELTALFETKKKLTLMTDYAGGEALKYQIEEINKMIEGLKEDITGTEKVESTSYRFEIDITKPNEEITIGKLDKRKGLYSTRYNDYLFYDSKFQSIVDSGKVLKLSLSVIAGLGNVVKNNMTDDSSGDKGLAYRIPVSFSAKLKLDSKPIAAQQIALSQFGSIAHMPYKLNKAGITYYEELGFIKTVSTEGTSATSTQIQKGGELTNSGIELLKKKDELTKLKEENALLEEKKKNKELKAATNEF